MVSDAAELGRKPHSHDVNAMPQIMLLMTSAVELGRKPHSNDVNALPQSMHFRADAAELGFPGAMGLLFEALVPL